MALKKHQLEVYARIKDTKLKVAVTIVFLMMTVCVLIVIIVLCFATDKGVEKTLLAIIECIMVNAIRPLAKHFFPVSHSVK